MVPFPAVILGAACVCGACGAISKRTSTAIEKISVADVFAWGNANPEGYLSLLKWSNRVRGRDL